MNKFRKIIFFSSVFASIIILFVIIGIIIFSLFYFLIEINGKSMEPNYKDREIWFIKKSADNTRDSVVVYEIPGNNLSMGRIMGVPGDKVLLSDCDVYINDELVPRIDDQCTSEGSFMKEGGEYIVPDDHYFLLGDNRGQSRDSRFLGMVKEEYFKGNPQFKLNFPNN